MIKNIRSPILYLKKNKYVCTYYRMYEQSLYLPSEIIVQQFLSD